MMSKKLFLCFLGLGLSLSLWAADTLRLSLVEAEKRFLAQNLLLIAQKLQVDAQKALILQAKLWNNPVFSIEQNIYNPNTQRALDMTATGESIVQLEQLLLLAKKRQKRVHLEELNTELAQLHFEEVLRNLRFELRQHFWQIYFSQNTLRYYREEIESLKNIISHYREQFQKNNIALKEVVRLEAFLYQLQHEELGLQTDLLEHLATLRLLLGVPVGVWVLPVVEKAYLENLPIDQLKYTQLLQESAKRADGLLAEKLWQTEKQHWVWQKSLASPDLQVGLLYDRAGSYIQNYTAFTLQMALPLFDRNQGNILAAERKTESQYKIWEQKQLSIQNEIWVAYEQVLQTNKLYKNIQTRFYTDFERLIEGVNLNYQKKNITLIEFLDFYDSYKNSLVQANLLAYKRMFEVEKLNFAVGKIVLE